MSAAITLDQLDPRRAHTTFDHQDSGCVSYGIDVGHNRWFVKHARTESAERSLERSLRFHGAVSHRSIVAPAAIFRTPGLVLVYPWVDGKVLNRATVDRSDRRALDEFRSLDAATRCAAITTVLDVHRAVAAHGFVAVDFYDGCLLYDFVEAQMHLIDLDEYRPGPFMLEDDRLPGSRSYMAPEELQRGAVIDERTMVFQLGRMIDHLLQDAATQGQAELARLASKSDPEERIQRVEDLWNLWAGVAP